MSDFYMGFAAASTLCLLLLRREDCNWPLATMMLLANGVAYLGFASTATGLTSATSAFVMFFGIAWLVLGVIYAVILVLRWRWTP